VRVLLAGFEKGDEVEAMIVDHLVDDGFGVVVMRCLMTDSAGS
jgi:hypothetical protein